jgi:formamidopyrimidine-DNA glycosylase
MPELPEVETICRRLRGGGQVGERADRPAGGCANPSLIGRRILGSRITWPRTIAEPSVRAFRARIRGQSVRDVVRRAKYIVLPLTRDTLLVHLRMSGGLVLERADAPRSPYGHLTLTLDQGWRLTFINPRKFGRAWLTSEPGDLLDRLGPEPLDPRFTRHAFATRLRAQRRAIKPLLLDQTFLAGVGNIYADESLHRAGIHPLTRACAIPPARAGALWRSVRGVLRAAIRHDGTSFDAAYGGGRFLGRLRVYQRTGEPCRACRTPIERIVVAQRGTHFCPRCQRATR